MKTIVLYAALCLLLLAKMDVHCQKIYHYEISSAMRSTGFVTIEYEKAKDVKSDVVVLYVYSDFGPCKNYDVLVTVSYPKDTLIGKTDSLGRLYLDRNRYAYGDGYFRISIQPPAREERVLPLEQHVTFWGMRQNGKAPSRIVAKMPPHNYHVIHIRSKKPLDDVQIEKIRQKIISDPDKRPEIKGIEYEYVCYL